MPRKRPKSLETDVYRKLWQLEHYGYVRIHLWKKSYRYTLIDDFRQHITAAKNAYVLGYEILLRFRNDKVKCYNAAHGEDLHGGSRQFQGRHQTTIHHGSLLQA